MLFCVVCCLTTCFVVVWCLSLFVVAYVVVVCRSLFLSLWVIWRCLLELVACCSVFCVYDVLFDGCRVLFEGCRVLFDGCRVLLKFLFNARCSSLFVVRVCLWFVVVCCW